VHTFWLSAIAFMGLTVAPQWERNLDDVEIYRARVLAVAEDGTIAIIDRDQGHIVLLNDEGQLVKRIAAEGQGPGELQNPVEIAYSPQDQTFAVLDFANARLSKWHTSGDFASEFDMPHTYFRPGFRQSDAVFLTRSPFGREGETPTLLVLDLKTGKQQTIWESHPEVPIVFSRLGNHDSGGEMVWRWNPALLYGLGEDFVAVAFGSDQRFEVLRLDGTRIGKPIAAGLPTFPVTEDQIAEGMDLMPANMRKDLRAGLVKPSGWPVIRNLLVDGHNRIWVIGASADVTAFHPYKVFSKDGQELGSGKIEKLPLAANSEALYYLKGEEDLYLVKALIKQTG